MTEYNRANTLQGFYSLLIYVGYETLDEIWVKFRELKETAQAAGDDVLEEILIDVSDHMILAGLSRLKTLMHNAAVTNINDCGH